MQKHPERKGKERFPFSQEKNAQGEIYCASETEMTGLIPSGQPDESERENYCVLYKSPSPRDKRQYRMPSSA